MQVITSRIDFADGVFIGGGNPTTSLTPTAQSSMTTSVIDAPVGQELQLSDLQNISGGGAHIFISGLIVGGGTALMADMALDYYTGKGLGEHWVDAVGAATDWVNSQGDDNVAPTGDGKGCTDRDLPM